MLRLIKSSFLWQFVGGFAIGAAGMVAMHVSAQAAPSAPYALSANHR
jgi:hypothetical protein